MNGTSSIACLDAQDVGEIAASLLSLPDPSPHYEKKYEIAGNEDVNIQSITAAYKKVLKKEIYRLFSLHSSRYTFYKLFLIIFIIIIL
jgi:hypothetical protein